MNRLISLLLLTLVAILSGCASAPFMPLSDDGSKIDPSKPLFLMSIVVKNDYSERLQPRILNVILERDSGAAKPEVLVFRMDDKGTITPDSGNSTYLVRFPADVSPHIVRGFNSMASAFPIHGIYFLPLHASISKSEGGVYYLGSIKAVIRERKDNEFRAGPMIPLIDQAIAGGSTGTFNVEISDAYDADVVQFRKTFPALNDVEIKRSVLPKWERAKAQLFWEQN